MRKHYIKQLISQGEHQQLDFKFEISDAEKIARTLVAFANTEGGKLLIGVKDNGVVKGVSSDEEYFMLENAAQRYCQPEISFTSKEWLVEGKKVLEVDIPFSPLRPHRAPDQNGNYRVFVRVKDENFLANGVLMKLWKKQKAKKSIKITYTEIEEKLLKYLKENSSISISTFKKISRISKYKAESILADFILLDIINMEIQDNGARFVLSDKNNNLPEPNQI
jgi:predicted HTH transcriptional regulator